MLVLITPYIVYLVNFGFILDYGANVMGSPCPSNGTQSSHTNRRTDRDLTLCYWLVGTTNVALDAEEDCAKAGGVLAYIPSDRFLDDILAMWSSYVTNIVLPLLCNTYQSS